jgi:hypothetical protein
MIQNKYNFMLVGAPGVAKTALVEQGVARAEQDLVVFHPVISDPTDFKGMPAIIRPDGSVDSEYLAKFVPFENLRRLISAERPTVAFFDDAGQAPPMVQAALMQLVLARKLDDKEVSKHITFIVATNRKEDKAGVSGVLEPLKSRFVSIIELVPEVKAWLRWAVKEGRIHPYVRAHVKVMGEKALFDFSPTNDMTNSVCPRTVKHVSDIMWGKPPVDLRMGLIAGAIGGGWATTFEGFIKIVKSLPKMEAIIKHPDKCPVPPSSEVGAQYAIVEAMIDQVTTKNGSKYLNSFLTYISRFKSEFQQWFISQIREIDDSILKNAAFTKWAAQAGIE